MLKRCGLVIGFMFVLITNASTQTPTLADLGWMVGDWQTAAGGKTKVEEHWTTAAGGTMMGLGRTVAGDKTVEFEYLRIEQRAEGVFYVAHPKARCPGTDFKLTRVSATEAVFENPQHDFPQRVGYRREGTGLVAWIEGARNGQTRRIEFPYRRTRCDAATR